MKKQIAASALLSLCLLSANAMANDAILGAVLGGGAGAFVGHSIGGRDATIIGGAIGAAAGAAIASDNDRRHVRVVERRVTYVAQPTYYAPPPRPVYHVQPVRVVQAPVYYVHGRKVSHHQYREWQRDRREHRRDVRYYGY